MRIGYLCDGDAEIETIGGVLRKTESPHTLVGPIKTALQIDTRVENVASAARKGVVQLKALGAAALVVLLDREQTPDCAPALATRICAALRAEYAEQFTRIEVVIKDRTYENWLIGDAAAIAAQPARFALSKTVRDAAMRGTVDNLDGLAVLKGAAIRNDYAKIADAQRIASRCDPMRIAMASRSFRRLLRVHGEPRYAEQSKNPNR